MTREQLAGRLNNRNVIRPIAPELSKIIKNNRLLVCYWHPQDCIVLKGIIDTVFYDDECEGATIIMNNGIYHIISDMEYFDVVDISGTDINHVDMFLDIQFTKDNIMVGYEEPTIEHVTMYSNLPTSPFVLNFNGVPFVTGLVFEEKDVFKELYKGENRLS
jgi:hypothetical protein